MIKALPMSFQMKESCSAKLSGLVNNTDNYINLDYPSKTFEDKIYLILFKHKTECNERQ